MHLCQHLLLFVSLMRAILIWVRQNSKIVFVFFRAKDGECSSCFYWSFVLLPLGIICSIHFSIY
jgi:threonine/homoserine efflux transporter RhtA